MKEIKIRRSEIRIPIYEFRNLSFFRFECCLKRYRIRTKDHPFPQWKNLFSFEREKTNYFAFLELNQMQNLMIKLNAIVISLVK